MAELTITDRIAERVAHLPPELQRQVLEFAEALAGSHPKGEPGPNLLGFAGSLDHRTAEEMRAAIEEGCERVEPNEW